MLRSSVETLLEGLLSGHAVDRLENGFWHHVGYRPSASEVRSWKASLPVLAADLRDAGLSSVEVLVEFRRVD